MRLKSYAGLLILLLGIFLSACQGSGVGADGLRGALSYVPNRDDLVLVAFTNWKDFQGDEINGAFPSSNLGTQWMWHTADLDWEVELNLEGGVAPVRVYKFQDDFNFEPVIALYEEREFEREDSGRAILFTHETDMSANPPILSHANTIIMPEAGIMVLTSGGGIDDLSSLLSFYTEPEDESSFINRSAYEDVVQELEPEFQVIIALDRCAFFRLEDIIELGAQIGLNTESESELRELQSSLQEYDFVSIGYHQETIEFKGKIIFSYETQEMAAADLPIREALVGETNYSLDEIRNDDTNLILNVTQSGNEATFIIDLARPIAPGSALYYCP